MSCALKNLPTSFGFNQGYNQGFMGGQSSMGGGKFITIAIILLGIIAYTSYSIYKINQDDPSDLENNNIHILSLACVGIVGMGGLAYVNPGILKW